MKAALCNQPAFAAHPYTRGTDMTDDRRYPPARPTIYRGIKMRSRLEARFAEGLDANKVKWAYEPVCYADGSGQYLPDFRIEIGGEVAYIEVKPTEAAAKTALEHQMPIIWSSEPAAHLAAVWRNEQEEGFAFGAGTGWFGETRHPRVDIRTWIKAAGIPVISDTGDRIIIDDYQQVTFDIEDADVVERFYHETTHQVTANVVMWTGRPLPPADGWRVVYGDSTDSPWGARSIEVNNEGRVTDKYSGQSWTMTPLCHFFMMISHDRKKWRPK